jgi:Protein of unknown function (DUF3108)
MLRLTATMIAIALALGGARRPAPEPLQQLSFEQPTGQARYAFYWLGAQVASSTMSLRVDGDGYGLALTARTEGLLRSFVDAQSQLEASGAGAPADAQPRLYRTESVVRKERLRRAVRFDADGQATVVEVLAPKEGWGSAREPVPAALQTGPDPVAAMLRLFGRPVSEETRLRAFDGVQSVDYRYRCDASLETLPKTARSGFVGQARRCTLAFEVMAGRAIDEEARKARERERDRPPATIWIAQAKGQALWIPVRLEQRGRWGTVTGYLTSFGPLSAS